MHAELVNSVMSSHTRESFHRNTNNFNQGGHERQSIRQSNVSRQPFPVLEYPSENFTGKSRHRPALMSSSTTERQRASGQIQKKQGACAKEGILPVVQSRVVSRGKIGNRANLRGLNTQQQASSKVSEKAISNRPRSGAAASSARSKNTIVDANKKAGSSVDMKLITINVAENVSEKNDSTNLEEEKGILDSSSNLALNSSGAEFDGGRISIEGAKEACLSSLSSKFESHIITGICDEIISCKTTFGDIASLDEPKRILHEAIMLPLLIPELFVGIREPWKGVLLFGPPGTGKTLLAKAVAGSRSTFFNMSSSTLIHKYRGESEKILKCLFCAARIVAPSVIFFDEIDAIASIRGTDTEHEASRRLKSELLSQIDGVGGDEDAKGVVVLATTNAPWDLDQAMLRRLEKRIYIPLPGQSARLQHINLLLKDVTLDDSIDIDDIVAQTDGYSGADLHLLCREALMGPMRRHLANLTPSDIDEKRNNGTLEEALQLPPVMQDDFRDSLQRIKASVDSNSLLKFEEWDSAHGSR